MPFPFGAIATTIGTALGIGSTNKQNKRSQQFAIDRYNQERKDNLVDWHTQNTYNSPQEQMKRFQEAGLNKNLIYGQGNSGNASNASATKTQGAQFKANDFEGIPNAISSYWDTEIKKNTNDNLKKTGDNIEADTVLKLSDVNDTDQGAWLTGSKRDEFEESQKYWADAAAEKHRQLLNKGLISDEQLTQSKALSRIKNMEALLADKGIFKGSNAFNSLMGFMVKGVSGLKPNFGKKYRNKSKFEK